MKRKINPHAASEAVFALCSAAAIICTSIFGLSDYVNFEGVPRESVERSDAVTVPAFAEADCMVSASGWYTMPQTDGSRPPLPPEFSFNEKHGAVYLGEDEKVIYLTFDAGYSNENVVKILDTLNEKGVKGTFFLNGGIFKYTADVVKRISDDGHCVGNHTESHLDLTKVTDEAKFAYEFRRVEERFKELTGKDIGKFMRPPEGTYDERVLTEAEKLGYRTVLWSVAYKDWDKNDQPDTKKAMETLLGRTHNGAVILLHPTSATNAKILGPMIDEWRAKGYTFRTLSEMTV